MPAAPGTEMELDLETLSTDDDGREVVIFRFRPVGGAAGDNGDQA